MSVADISTGGKLVPCSIHVDSNLRERSEELELPLCCLVKGVLLLGGVGARPFFRNPISLAFFLLLRNHS